MSNKGNTRKQHYVPQSYLDQFKNSSDNIFCFDKTRNKKFKTGTRGIACENWFYDDRGPQKTENRLARLQDRFKPIMSELIEKRGTKFLDDSKSQVIAEFLANQAVRTLERREHIEQALRQLNTDNEDILEEKSRELQKELLDNHIDDIETLLLQKDWFIMESESDAPFWTSDNPVVLFNPLQQPNKSSLGFGSKGVQVYFPLTPRLCLSIVDRSVYGVDGRSLLSEYTRSDECPVKLHNRMQAKWCTRHIFSNDGKFALAQSPTRDNSELRRSDRVRIKQPHCELDLYQRWMIYMRWWRNRWQ